MAAPGPNVAVNIVSVAGLYPYVPSDAPSVALSRSTMIER
jgi:hypothetical protein